MFLVRCLSIGIVYFLVDYFNAFPVLVFFLIWLMLHKLVNFAMLSIFGANDDGPKLQRQYHGIEGFFNTPTDFQIALDEDSRVVFHYKKADKSTYDLPGRKPLAKDWAIFGQKNRKGHIDRLTYFHKETRDNWVIAFDEFSREVTYNNVDTGVVSTDDPARGPLPQGWGQYFRENGSTAFREQSKDNWILQDPREMPVDLSIACASTARDRQLRGYKRQPLLDTNIRNHYKIIKTLDPGAGHAGAIGAMNGGVFIVRHRQTRQLFVEKRFLKQNGDASALQEICMIRNLYHDALTAYSAAFTASNPWACSIYLEFCDMGSLGSLLKTYSKKQRQGYTPMNIDPVIPEAFIWHSFIGLCDALSYLLTGQSTVAANLTEPDEYWKPIVHRDIKPDNVLIRSRSTPGPKYPYVVISDFGLATKWEPNHRPGAGTMIYWAPENTPFDFRATHDKWKGCISQTPKSDVWSLGATICNLVKLDKQELGHVDRTQKPPGLGWNDWFCSRESRKTEQKISQRYSTHLEKAINYAMRFEHDNRPTADKLVKLLQMAQKNANPKFEMLPEWAVKKHHYPDE